jgi:hypothetical protein
MSKKAFVGILLALIFLTSLAAGRRTYVFATSYSEAKSALENAQDTVIADYRAVRDAETKGANVSGLVLILDDAGALLSEGYLAYEKSQYDLAADYAQQCQQKLQGFTVESSVLTQNAEQQSLRDLLVNASSIVGTTVVVCGSLLIWSYLKRKYAVTGKIG